MSIQRLENLTLEQLEYLLSQMNVMNSSMSDRAVVRSMINNRLAN